MRARAPVNDLSCDRACRAVIASRCPSRASRIGSRAGPPARSAGAHSSGANAAPTATACLPKARSDAARPCRSFDAPQRLGQRDRVAVRMTRTRHALLRAPLAAAVLGACGRIGYVEDAGPMDVGAIDANVLDAGEPDTARIDVLPVVESDGSPADAGSGDLDARTDPPDGPLDGGPPPSDGEMDAGAAEDAGAPDAPVSAPLEAVFLASRVRTAPSGLPISVTSDPITPPPNALLIAVIGAVNNQNDVSAGLSASGGGLTWTLVRQTGTAPGFYNVGFAVWRAQLGPAPGTFMVTASHPADSGGDPARLNIQLIAFRGASEVMPIGATAGVSGLATNGAATLTLPAAPLASSIVLGARLFVAGPATDATAEPAMDWMELYDEAGTAGYGDLQTQVRGGSTSREVSWLDTNVEDIPPSECLGLAAEIRAL